MSSSMEPRPLISAFESPTFDEDSSIHVEQPVGSMSISPCGRDVVLASKEGLHVIDLDSPYSPPRYLPHHTPWEVADVQWSPFASRDYWVVSTSNQKALVWNLAMKTWQNSIEHVLHAHSRAITDINFSAFHPDLLATCAVDSFVHCWDLRTPSRPAISFSDWFTGATQVKWNRQDPHVVASSHDRFLRIWDDRMGAYPIRSIEAHDTKIYGIDWNRVRRGALATCSLDKTIKFWDYTSEADVPEKLIRTPFPIWRARNTPFGWGVLAMPQRGNSDLHLYSRRAGEGSNPEEDLPLVHSFPGHKGQVKEFLWRPRGGVVDGIDHREFQLVTWGTDRELRLHRVDPEILERVGYEKGKSFISTRNVTRLGAVYRSFRDVNSDLDLEDLESASSINRQNMNTTIGYPGGPGMNAISVPHSRAWTRGGHVDTRVGMQPRSNLRADTNPIAWMRGVKISGWDIETLGDEISHVGEKFTKVVFDSVDVRQRKISISLNGPWGAEGASLYLKVDIKFPVSYPKSAIPTFSFQKTAAVTDELAARITAELRTIAETYMSRKRGCLEGAVRHLLGESSLEESIALILGEAGDTVKSPVNGDLEGDSSDEDEVGMTQSQELGMSSELLRPVNANVMVPVAKACGALWANDGRLVCFFPPKKDESTALFDNLGFKEMSRLSRTDKVFEGFGRLQTSSPGPRTNGTITSTDDGASDESDDSYSETSSSSGSSDILSGLPTRFQAPQTWRSGGSIGIHRPRSADLSQRSTGGAAAKFVDAPRNVVSIHDFSDLLPVKRELASKYRICGKGTDVCAHNAGVALDAGYYELAQIWGLVKLVLQVRRRPDASVSSRFSPKSYRKTDGATTSNHIYEKGRLYKDLADSIVRWGDHPLGGHWLVPALFDHFERTGDVQMIAMLTCVLMEANPQRRAERQQEDRFQQAPSFDVSSIASTTQNKSQFATPTSSFPKEPNPMLPHTSTRSSNEIGRMEYTPPYSTGTTPPYTSRPRGIATDRKAVSHNVSIATSPDQPKSGSGFGSVLASSLSRSFTFGPSSASPPTNTLSKAKPSPAQSPSVATMQPTQSDTESDRPPRPTKSAARAKVTFKNRSAFEGEDSAPDFLLDRSKDWLWRSYRAAYADLLSIWQLPIQQSEVLKIGAVANDTDDIHTSQYWSSRSSKAMSQQNTTDDPNPPFEGLDFQRHCANCGHAMQLSIFAGEPTVVDTPSKRHREKLSDRRCLNCKPRQALPTKLPCVICGEVVDGMLVPCLSCGHVCCFHCHRLWFLRPGDTLDSQIEPTKESTTHPTCPSGCGCVCSEHIVFEVPMPPLQPSSPSLKQDSPGEAHRSPSHDKRHRRRQSEPAGPESGKGGTITPKAGQHVDDLELWQESSPFASLARGMGGGLSQGLGSKEERKKGRGVGTTTPKRR